jgi:hypothetical protein
VWYNSIALFVSKLGLKHPLVSSSSSLIPMYGLISAGADGEIDAQLVTIIGTNNIPINLMVTCSPGITTSEKFGSQFSHNSAQRT